MDVLAELVNLLLPAECVGCGQWDTTLCPECGALAQQARQSWELEGSLVGWSLGPYANELRRVILAAKHQRWARLDGWLWQAGWSLGIRTADDWEETGISVGGGGVGWWGSDQESDAGEGISVVPIPSRWRRQWEGMLITAVIAEGVAAALQARGLQASVDPILKLGWAAPSQRGGGKQQRRQQRPMRLVGNYWGRVLLVDDVLTTGTTLVSANRCLRLGTSVRAVTLARA